MLAGPLRLVSKDPDRQLLRRRHANTAMTEIATRFREQLCRRGVVHIHVVLVREHELDQAEGVLGTWELTDRKLSRAELLEHLIGYRRTRDRFTRGVYDFVTV